MDTVERIAEVVLYEGFLLYPYTRSTTKNQQRWTFGGVYPRTYSQMSGGDDPWLMRTQCLIVGDRQTEVDVRVRFLQVVDRTILDYRGGKCRQVEELRVGDETYRPWEEAVEREVSIGAGSDPVELGQLTDVTLTIPIDVREGSEEEPILDPAGNRVGALLRTWPTLSGEVRATAEPNAAGCFRLTVEIVNTTEWTAGPEVQRATIVRRAMISTHTILRVYDGEFVSLLETPPAYRQAASECENIKTWPVLVGEANQRDTMLSSPIILYDYPQIAPESPVNFFDSTEIDELLVLSVMTLTEDEKREMRETDPRAREILDKTESLTPEELMALHGSIRSMETLRRELP